MAKMRILIVDDEQGMLEVCADTLQRLAQVEITTEQDSERASHLLSNENWDMLITDIRMPGVSGMELLHHARELDPELLILMLTAFPTVDTAIESMKLGAADYITKPFLPEDLLATVRRLLEQKRLNEENRLLQRQVERPYAFDEIIGRSPPMLKVFDTIQRLSETDADVLVLGETGTGKELVARSIHKRSSHRTGRFVPVDCGAIPEDLLESELFGHERGAFTGAHTRSLGLLEFANKGTFFLDEIGELPLRLQAKLLRVLQERKVRRVGGNEEIDIDVRVIAATSRNLDEEIRLQRFRSDLYYRINVGRIELPPLRERGEDIALLVEHFADRYGNDLNKDAVNIDAEVVEVLSNYSWPGNVRELQNALKRTLAMTRQDVIRTDDLPDEIVVQAGERDAGEDNSFFDFRRRHVAAFEKEYLNNLLTSCGGDVSQAAREAGLPRGTLYRLLKKYELNPSEFR